MISVIIINCYTKESDDHLNLLIQHFNDPLFKVSLLKVNHDQYKKNKDIDHFIQALTLASEQQYNHYLIIKDNTICTTSNLAKKIKKALLTPADIYFLASYNDACHLYQPVKNNKHLKVTVDCGATQAFLLTSSFALTLLGELKEKKKSLSSLVRNKIKNNSKAVVFYPPMMTFDAMLATSNDDYQKLNLCIDLNKPKEETDDTVIIVWILIICFLILFLVFLVPYFKYYSL